MPRRIAAFAAMLITVGTGALAIVPSSGARAAAATAAGPVRARGVAAHLAGVSEAWFFGTSCTSVRRCMAVGQKVTPPGTSTLAEEWAAGRWRVLPTPNAAGMTDSWLVAVSCSGGEHREPGHHHAQIPLSHREAGRGQLACAGDA